MTFKLLPLAALSLGLVTACTGDDDEPTDNTDDNNDDDTTDETTPTGETGTEPPPEPLLINAFTFYALFGFDQATSGVSSITDTTDPANPNTIRPYFRYSFFSWDPTSQTTDPTNACSVVVYMEGATFAPWATGDIYYGVDVDPVDVEHDCDGMEFGPDLTGVVEAIEATATGVGVGAVSDTMLDIFDLEGYDYDEDNTIGGYYQIAFFDPPDFSDAYGLAFEMNDNLETVTTPDENSDGYDELVVIPAADVVPTASGIPTAAYQTESFYFYYF
jgi:hypothetical protein